MDRLSSSLSEDWAKALTEELGEKVEIYSSAIVGGGSINDARRIDTSKGLFFIKLNDADKFEGMFEAEADGLRFLKEVSEFSIPSPLSTGTSGNTSWIIMENIASSSKKDSYWQNFAGKLARMHKQTSEQFGYKQDNYLGSLRQYNDKRSGWSDFFVEMRLEPQLKLAKDNGVASSEMVRLFEKLFSRADRYFPEEKPAALHGDLWSGNFMTDSRGDATIFDPAVYYGHREMDIGMSKLFGGYDNDFYKFYNEEFPLEPGWEERIRVANLYYLMAHANLFGGGYIAQVMGILRRHI